MTQFSPADIWREQALLFNTHDENPNTNISDFLVGWLVGWLVREFYGVSTLFESLTNAEINSKQFSLV